MEKKQSSIEWLVEQLIPNAMRMFDATTCNAIEQAKAMHKKEILIAYSKALPITDGVFTAIDKAHDYYNEQFGGNHE